MKIHHLILSLVFTTLSVACTAQCPKAGTKPTWDSNKEQFRCTDATATSESAQSELVPPKGDKNSCKSVREDLQRACPSGDEGKACKNSAKSIFEACYKGDENNSKASSSSSRTDSATCMATYQQQQQACHARVTPPRGAGQPSVPDTCLSDAMAAQNKCLANAR
jgi:hypothetical protein